MSSMASFLFRGLCYKSYLTGFNSFAWGSAWLFWNQFKSSIWKFFIRMWFEVLLSFPQWLHSEIIAHNLVVSGWKSLRVWLDQPALAWGRGETLGAGLGGGRLLGGKPNRLACLQHHIAVFRQYLSSNLPSTSLSQSRDLSTKYKMAATLASLLAIASLATAKPQVVSCDILQWKLWKYFVRTKIEIDILPGWFWIPLLIQCASGAEGAKHVHNVVWEHLHLPVCLQRGNSLPVHLQWFTNSLVREF